MTQQKSHTASKQPVAAGSMAAFLTPQSEETYVPSPATQTTHRPANEAIANQGDAETFLSKTDDILQELIDIVTEESSIVRTGSVDGLGDLAERKAELLRDYARAMDHVKNNRKNLSKYAPVSIDRLKRRHHVLRSELQESMQVLTTARSVSEQLVTNIAKAVDARLRPQTYGVHGRYNGGKPQVQGLSVNRAS